MEQIRFDGQVAIVTGAGKGLGRAYAMWLAQRGAKVVVNNRSHPGTPSSAQAVVEEIAADGGHAVADKHAMGTEADGKALIDTALKSFGRLDILVCNAGVSNARQPLDELPAETIEQVMAINFFGSLWPLRAALPAMRAARYGRVVLSASSTGLYGTKSNPIYGASKMALVGLAKCVAHDVADSDIRINVIAPAARTEMGKMLPEQFSELMSPQHVAQVVGWLCSRACQANGQSVFSGAGRARRASVIEEPTLATDPQAIAALGTPFAPGEAGWAPASMEASLFDMIPELRQGLSSPWLLAKPS